jgi:hypothetical protein
MFVGVLWRTLATPVSIHIFGNPPESPLVARLTHSSRRISSHPF